ncbi:MAG: methyltransferase domain-containing protein [Burkholderiales bacterium]|nr:methyltransferase domain-containing protein [Burkholderiales bacterium]
MPTMTLSVCNTMQGTNRFFFRACCFLLLWPTAEIFAQTVDLDVPFVTTPQSVSEAMLTIAAVGKQDFLIDLGSGDGRIVILAAKKFGARGLGVEIDPQLVAASRTNAKQAGVANRSEFRTQDLFKTDLTRASVITMYLLPDVNIALRPKLLALKPGTRIVSHDWDMGDWLPDAELRVPAPEKKLGLDRTSRVMLWTVPAVVDGRWCSRAHPALTLAFTQKYQRADGEVTGLHAFKFAARLNGAHLLATGAGEAHLGGSRLVFNAASPLAGTWRRATGACAGK